MNEQDPDLVIKGLSLWFRERAFPTAADNWDLDENRVTAIAGANGARVELSGLVSSTTIHYFGLSLDRLHERLEGEARLDCTDLGLKIGIKPTSVGHLAISVEMTPDYSASQSHRFAFEGDQTDLKPMVKQCRAILERLPSTQVPPDTSGTKP